MDWYLEKCRCKEEIVGKNLVSVPLNLLCDPDKITPLKWELIYHSLSGLGITFPNMF